MFIWPEQMSLLDSQFLITVRTRGAGQNGPDNRKYEY